MELDLIVLDTSVKIDYFRKSDKANSFFERLFRFNRGFTISVITHIKIMIGNNEAQNRIWEAILEDISLIDYHFSINQTAIRIYKELKQKNRHIPFQDMAIAATAIHHNYQLATINEKHFKNIAGIKLLTPAIFA
jgi:predicted nucleic acid-binding protein